MAASKMRDQYERMGQGLKPATDDAAFVDVGSDDLAEGCLRGVDIGDEHIVIARTGGRLCAIGGVCTHQVAFLEDGYLSDGAIHCPRHGAAFDLATGAALSAPAVIPLPVFDVRLEAGRVLVARSPRPMVAAPAAPTFAEDEDFEIDPDDDR